MNKYIEAFNNIVDYAPFALHDDLLELRELVEKATPKKMGKADMYESFSYCKCPVCYSIVASTHKYCSNCGQRIDTIVGDE